MKLCIKKISREENRWIIRDFKFKNLTLWQQNSLGEIGCLGNPYFYLLVAYASSFLIPPTQSVRLAMVTYPSLCSTCVTYGTPWHAIRHQVLPTQPLPREAEDFPRGDRYFKHVPLLKYLIYLSPKEITK